jgi:RNA polymerase sigma-70 factor (ECF subfamily)
MARTIQARAALGKEEGRKMNAEDTPRNRSLEQFRSYLLLLARLHLESEPRNRIDPSDIVQQTLLEAHEKAEQFSGDDSGLAAWLRQALVHNLIDARRASRRKKRDVLREQALTEAVEQSSRMLQNVLAAGRSSPSQRAVRNEELLRLADALAQLPQPQREAIVVHHLQGCSLAETAQRLAKTDSAVAGLLHRGLKKLRVLMSRGE